MMTKDEAQRIVDRKCVTPNCYHFAHQGVIYCPHCLHGYCRVMTHTEREEYLAAEKILEMKP